MSVRSLSVALAACLIHVFAPSALAGTAPHALPFSQGWADTALIALDDDWSAVPGVVGYRGDDLVAAAGADPQTIVADASATPVDVIANQTNPDALFAGGIAEFELADAAVALQGSTTADAPHLLASLDTRGYGAVRVSYTLRDLDGSGDDAVQPVALQYRVGASGDYTNLPAAFVADAASGPRLATLATPVAVTLPPAADDRPLVQLRFVTANAAGSDEWIAVDDVAATGTDLPPSLGVAIRARLDLARALALGLRPRVTVNEDVVLRARIRIGRALAERRRLPRVVGRTTVAFVAGTRRITVPFRPKAKAKLAALATVRVKLRIRATDAGGNATTATRSPTLIR